jgi:large repetitive protein
VQLTADLGTQPYKWLAIQGSPPDGLTLDATGLISGTPTTPTLNNSFTVRVTDALNAVDTKAFSILINKTPLTVNLPASFPQGWVGVAYSASVLRATGGIGPYAWSVSSGALPPGLTLDSATAAIAGIPQQPTTFDSGTRTATYSLTIQVKDTQGTTAALDQSLVINLGPLITTTSLNLASIGKPYNQTLTASFGVIPYQWVLAADSDLLRNPGLDLNPSTGQITGTAQGPPKKLNIKIEVRDKFGALGTAAFPLIVTDLAMTTDASLPDGFPGEPYTVKLAATGGSGTYSWQANSALPSGLSLAADGTISGTPTVVNTYTLTATLSDGNVTIPVGFNLSIKLRPIVPVITGVSSSVAPQFQPQIKVSIPQAYKVDIIGALTLAFHAMTQTATDDPAVQFSTGGRSASFTIPAGNTDAVFGSTAFIVLQAGTMAANLTLTATFTAAGAPLIPNPAVTLTTAILAQQPAITTPPTVNLTPTTPSADFEVTVTGYATTRELTDASFSFTAKNNFNLTGGTVTIANFGAAATAWYASPSSSTSGGAFLFTQPFKVSGDKTGIASVTVTLKNTAGTSATATANLP